MNTPLLRTSFVIPAPLHQRLTIAAQQEGKNVSELVRGLLDQALARHEQARISHMYRILAKMEGMGGRSDQPYQSVDEILYGEHGVWRGTTPTLTHE